MNQAEKGHAIGRLNEAEARANLPQLIALLQDAVHDGASIGFLSPLANDTADQYWQEVIREVGKGTRILLIARQGHKVAGSVQLSLCTRQNGLHRAEVQKLMVHTRWRNRGMAKALMSAIEREACAAGRSLLYLDTEPGKPAEKLYERSGWTRAGEIPGYACSPDGHLHGAAIFYRIIRDESDKVATPSSAL